MVAGIIGWMPPALQRRHRRNGSIPMLWNTPHENTAHETQHENHENNTTSIRSRLILWLVGLASPPPPRSTPLTPHLPTSRPHSSAPLIGTSPIPAGLTRATGSSPRSTTGSLRLAVTTGDPAYLAPVVRPGRSPGGTPTTGCTTQTTTQWTYAWLDIYFMNTSHVERIAPHA